MRQDNGKPAVLGNGNGQTSVPTIWPIRREHYLSRFGSAATLMVVEVFTADDGAEQKRMRFCPWPGL